MLKRIKRWLHQRASIRVVDESTGFSETLIGGYSDTAAQNLSAVSCAVDVIAGTASILPLFVYERIDDNVREKAPEHPVYFLLHRRPNVLHTPSKFKRIMFRHLLLHGNSYTLISRDNAGQIKELIPLHPLNVDVRWNNEIGNVEYFVLLKNSRLKVAAHDMIHVFGNSDDGIKGLSTLTLAARSLGLANDTENFASAFFKKGLLCTHKVTVPETLGPDKVGELRNAVTQMYSGNAKAHGIFVGHGGADLETLTLNGRDAMFLESRQFSIEDIARWFNIQPHKLKHWGKSTTYGNLESENTSFVQDTMMPWLVAFEEEKTTKLLGDDSQYYVEFETKALLRGDQTTRSSYYSTMLDKGILSINEIRRFENLPPIDGGDEHQKPLNMGTVGSGDQKPDDKPAEKPDDTDNVRAAMKPIIISAFERLAAVEADRLERMAKRNPDDVRAWAKQFFTGEHRHRVEQVLTPIIAAYSVGLYDDIDKDTIVDQYINARVNLVDNTSDPSTLPDHIRSIRIESI